MLGLAAMVRALASPRNPTPLRFGDAERNADAVKTSGTFGFAARIFYAALDESHANTLESVN